VSEPVPTPEDQRASAFLDPCNCYGERADKTRARLAKEFASVRAEEREACARVLDARAEHHERVARETRDDISEDYAAEARGGAKVIRARRSDP
jgi:hypothetical protein